jgi:hypothetical protein
MKLRSRRLKILDPQKIIENLDLERAQLEKQIMRLQGQFYNEKAISKSGYDSQFRILNERLAEVESEKMSADLMAKKKPALATQKKKVWHTGKMPAHTGHVQLKDESLVLPKHAARKTEHKK